MPILQETPQGLYCAAGDFYVDPWRPVPRAVVTHAHGDHARSGSASYLAARSGAAILQMRLGPDARISFVDFGDVQSIGAARVSLHPAGHMTGAAQVRIEVAGEVCVVSGDYKLQDDPTCAPFEPVRCHTFVTESTFGLPIYRWDPPVDVFAQIDQWWRNNQAAGKTSVLFGYTVGKAERILASVDSSIGPIFAHGAIINACRAYRACGVKLPPVHSVSEAQPKFDWSQALIVAPPSALGSTWLRRFGDVSTGLASGWMRVRGIRRRRAIDRGFVLSDHVDWQDLMAAIKATEAEHVWVTHGYTSQVVRTLQSRGYDARTVVTQFTGESAEVDLASARDEAADEEREEAHQPDEAHRDAEVEL
ncbi:MAG: ligase-associated DNA damage response exonuclease [Aureliella sp.]